MKASIFKKYLADLLTIVTKDPVVPILESILFTDNKMIVSRLTEWAMIDFPHDQTFCVNALYLKRIVDSLSADEDINFISNPETFNVQVLINGEPCYNVLGDNPKDYPKLPSFNEDHTYFLFSFQDDTKETINEVLNFVSNDDLRPSMKCVFIDDQTAVGTDGHRMCTRSISHLALPKTKLKGEDEKATLEPIEGVLIPGNAFRILNKTKLNFDVSVVFVGEPLVHEKSGLQHFQDPYYVKFVNKHFTLYSRAYDERYPQYKNVIPQLEKINHFEIEMKTVDLIKIIKQAMVTANKVTNRIVFNMKSVQFNLVSIQSEDLDFGVEFKKDIVVRFRPVHNVKETLVINTENKQELIPLEMPTLFDAFALNGKFLLEILKWINPGDTIVFSVEAPNRAIIINGNNLLMPVMISAYENA